MSLRRRRNALAPAVRATVAKLESRLLLAEVAGELFVDIDATQLPEGPVTSIPNNGTMTGSFDPTGGGDTVPVIDQPLAASAVGTKGIRLDGNDYLQLAIDGGLQPAPPGLVGVDPTRTVEAWVWNPGVQGEETMVSWSRRDGPNGTNMSFNYGSSGAFGAVGHWGPPDIGWGAGLVPVARRWHHLVYTYDGPTFTTRVYVDGVQTNTEVLAAGTINTPANFPINIGTQMLPTNVPFAAARGSLTLGKVRIHDGVLTPEQVRLNFDAEKAGFIEPDDTPVPPPPAVVQVDINPTAIGDGPVTSIPNTGPAGGAFAATGAADTVPAIALPVPNATSGTRGLRLDGNDFLRHVQDATATPLVDQAPPSSLVGADPRTSMDAWVWNPNVTAEETMLAWGRRGGLPDGTNMSFNYGSSGAFGAVGHWGAPDIGWGTVPTAQHWHHLVHTFDGTTTRVYVDGVQTNTEVIGEGALLTPATPPINIGSQNTAAGLPDGGQRGSLTLGRVRIYSGVLTPAQIQATYDAEKGNYVEPGIPPPPDPVALTAPPIHRYSFNAPAGDATAGVIEDSIGDADGVVKGPGATWNGSRLVLPGGPSATAPYGDLPNNLLSSMGADTGAPGLVTIEGWARNTGSQNWSRFFDFGASGALEINEPGGLGNGTTYLMLSAQVGGDTALHRFELFNFTGSTQNRTVDVGSPTFNTDVHFAVTWDDNTGNVRLYEQGVEVAAFTTPFRMAQMIDVNNWLGRSNYNVDNNLQGQFDEFRIYDHVLTPGEVRGNFQAGANVVTSPGTPVAEVYVKGASWLGQDNVPATVNFMEYLENKGLGDDVLGYRLFGTGRTPPAGNPEDIIPWINADQVVLRYAEAPTGSGVPTPGNLTVTGRNQALSSYTVTGVTPVAGDPTAFVLQLNKPLGGGNPETGVAPSFDENGDYVTISVPGAGPAGSTFTHRMKVLQGDTDHLDETAATHAVLARDFAEVKKRFFKDTDDVPTGDGTDYTPFHDVDGSGSILARDFAEVKKRFFQSLPPPPAAAAASLGGASITSDLFGTTRIL